MNTALLSLSYETAEKINRAIDVTHSFFPTLSMLAIFFLLESFLGNKEAFENAFDQWYTYAKIPLLALLNFIALSQGFLGGCAIYYPQVWFNRKYLGVDQPYEFGLFFRQSINPDFWWALRGLYLLGSLLILWRTWVFFKKRVLIKAPVKVKK
jgi:hypothetical protein